MDEMIQYITYDFHSRKITNRCSCIHWAIKMHGRARNTYRNLCKIDRRHFAKFDIKGRFQLRFLGFSELHETINYDSQFLPSRIVQHNRAVAGSAGTIYSHLPDGSLPVEHAKIFVRTGQALVQGKADVQSFKIRGVHEILHPEDPADLLIRHEGDVNGALIALSIQLESANRLQVLYPDAFHVLAAASVDVTLLVHVSAERWIGPFVLPSITRGESRYSSLVNVEFTPINATYLEDGHNVHVAVQEDSRLRRLCSYPCENHDRFIGMYVIDLDWQVQRLRLSLYKCHAFI